jgi:hypothetical protein
MCGTCLHEYCSKTLCVLKNFFFCYSDNAQRNKERKKGKQKKVYEKKERKYVCDGFAYEKTLK